MTAVDTTTTTTAITAEEEDVLRHAFAVGTVALRAVADIATVGAIDDRPMSSGELGMLRSRLHQVFQLLFNVTISEVGREAARAADEPAAEARRTRDEW